MSNLEFKNAIKDDDVKTFEKYIKEKQNGNIHFNPIAKKNEKGFAHIGSHGGMVFEAEKITLLAYLLNNEKFEIARHLINTLSDNDLKIQINACDEDEEEYDFYTNDDILYKLIYPKEQYKYDKDIQNCEAENDEEHLERFLNEKTNPKIKNNTKEKITFFAELKLLHSKHLLGKDALEVLQEQFKRYKIEVIKKHDLSNFLHPNNWVKNLIKEDDVDTLKSYLDNNPNYSVRNKQLLNVCAKNDAVLCMEVISEKIIEEKLKAKKSSLK